MPLRNRLKYWRHQKMMNQKEFAEFLGVHPSQISVWENNKQLLHVAVAWEFKKKLNCNLEELYEETPE